MKSSLDQKIIDAVEAIGRSELKLNIFKAVYYHKSRVKSVDDIAAASGLTREQVLKNGIDLKKAGLFDQEKKDGVTAYKQIEYYQHNKDKIVRFVKDPSKMDKFEGRQPIPAVQPALSFVKYRPSKVNVGSASKKIPSPKMKIAFLTTNPAQAAFLRTDMEMREVTKAIRKSQNRDYVEMRHLPAAQVEDLLDALNEFRPDIVHFSGHGGDGAVVFDNRDADDDGGVVIDFSLVHEIVSATHSPPKLLVLNACDTVDGAKVLLKTVRAVVAMSDEITDSAAIMFSTQFYAALVGGQPLSLALKQGMVVLRAAKLPDADLPKLLLKPGVDGASLKFI